MDLPSRWPDVPPSVVHLLQAAATRAPGAEALVCGEERVGYDTYWNAVCELAAALRTRGVVEGDRVAVVLPNGIDICIASLAVMAAGAVLVPLNPLYTAHELAYILGDSRPRLIIAEPDHAAVREAGQIAGITEVVPPTIRPNAPVPRPTLPEPGALAMIQYTGGTTGKPKGVMLSHAALAGNVAQREARLPTMATDRVLIVTPLYHSYATAMGLFLAMNCAGTLIVLPRYDGDAVLRAIPAERASLFAGAPAIYIELLTRPLHKADLSSLRLCYSGSAALSRDVLARWQDEVRCPIVEGYGQTEAGPILTYMGMTDGIAGSVGTALPGTEVEIVDATTGAGPLPAGTPGEIRARGPQIMQGYWDKPEETAAALRDGWLHTGDIGTLDPEGVLTIQDRKKDMVIVSGFNVYPREIEEELLAHASVREAAVVGRPDPKKGEALVAFVVAGPDGAEEPALRAHLAARLTRYKQPAEIRFIETLPKSPIGKTDKTALRALA